jgi:phosphatidylglycerol:prolipoprotein diacylglycerol transferase
MLSYPNIDPVILTLGPLQVRWYGLMYVIGFSAAYYLVSSQIKRRKLNEWSEHFENINFVLILSLIIGARIGYALFYNFPYYTKHPLEVFAVWQGGMSFHGAMLGVIIGGAIYCRKNRLNFWQGADLYVVTIPIGLGFGRIGNFINGELFGRVTDVNWAMVFPYGGPMPRHPSQLYECFLEGFVLFFLLWNLKNRRWPAGSMLACFLIFYGIFRSFVELFREPDPQLGFVLINLTMGQVLSICMVAAGIGIIIYNRRNKPLSLG